ncbi:ShlB/FhaC/HecB family hemolysin secretion/activation protein [Anabaena sp. UHCC 0253]|uniref:ShlB/FhaC/HecB family hemolysin secretion/activation protein n=1 Tax=Anabaena sp. UHCC 0253 TaxID=2590019 RepID=UPI0014461C24|nr:ShlB/FhaC/HecB family hemolysin secretion/activation protein [Anabaena sp. UHCC 0253]
MINRHLNTVFLILPGLIIVGNIAASEASSNNSYNQIFTPYLQQIKNQLEPGLLLRLPSQVPTIDISAEKQSNYRVKVSPSLVNPGITVSIFNCQLESQACLVGSLSVNSPASLGSREELSEHQNSGSKIILKDKISGYLVAGEKQNPPSEFSSVMWEQDGLISRIRFRQNSQNIVAVANSMVTAVPINNLTNIPDISINDITATSIAPKSELPTKLPDSTVQISEPSQNIPTSEVEPQISEPNQDSKITSEDNSESATEFVAPTTTEKVTSTPQTPTKIALIPIRLIKVTGNTVFSEDKINQEIQKFEGKDFTPEELGEKSKEIADTIKELYQKNGYIATARPLPDQTIKNGVIEINVTETRLVKIEILGTERLKSYVMSRLQLATGETFNAGKIEDKLRLLKQDPLFTNVEANLSDPPEDENNPQKLNDGSKILVVTVKEAPTLATNISVDNQSPATIGSEKVGVGFSYRNVTGLGDIFAANYSTTFTGGSKVLDFGYQIPVNSMNGQVQLRASFNSTKITQSPFDELDIKGEKQIYEIFYRQPIVRTSQKELALSLGLSVDNGQTFTFDQPTAFGFGPNEDGVSRSSVISFRQDYTSRDLQGAWFLDSEFKIGTGLFNPTSNKEPVPDGYFFSWSGQVQRWQQLSKNNLLIVKANLQLTPDGLLPSHQFILGGGQSVRGYRQNTRSGDNGLFFSIENRITLNSTFKVAPFLDLGKVWNASQNPNELSKQTFLISSGIGLIWQPLPGLNLRLDYGFPFINLEDKSNNIQDNGFYFNINYQP